MSRPILVIDFGAQYAQLIARRVRELGFYSEIVRHSAADQAILERRPQALILTGGPDSVVAPGAKALPEGVLKSGLPTLGICYGMHLLAHALGGTLSSGEVREYGRTDLSTERSVLFTGLPRYLTVWMSHGDTVSAPPPGFRAVGKTRSVPVAAMEDEQRRLFAVQFHPEVAHTDRGTDMLKNFLCSGAGLTPDWTTEDAISLAVDRIRRQVKEGRALVALSGGVDSAVAAALVHRAIGDHLLALFVDHGLLRQGEAELVEAGFTQDYPLPFRRINAQAAFLAGLKGVKDPEEKRKRIGRMFIDTFRAEAERLNGYTFLVQGTLYPDVIESGGGQAAVIKSHHNVGGLPEEIGFELVEPLRDLFKDEVRAIGRELGLPPRLVERQPFPGPGLAVRVVGAVSAKRLAIARAADAIVTEELEKAGSAAKLWQYFAVLTGTRSVGVMGDGRTYHEVVAIRTVTSADGMTADWGRLPLDLLEKMANRIVSEVREVGRVVYDITSKPPGTIEWE